MGTQDFGTIEANASLKQVIDALADLQDKLNFLLNGQLDVKNLRANSINADRIKAKTITADRMNVTQLSAISADLGKVVAGILIGAYISTADGTYPRIDFSSTGNLLQAFTDPNNYISIVPNSGGQPLLEFKTGTTSKAVFFAIPGSFAMNTQVGNLSVQAQAGDLSLSANNVLKLNGASLQINSTPGVSGTFYVSATSGGPATTPVTFTNGIRTA